MEDVWESLHQRMQCLLIPLFLVGFFCGHEECGYGFVWCMRHWLYPWLWNNWLKFFSCLFPSDWCVPSIKLCFCSHLFFFLLEAFPGIPFMEFYWIDAWPWFLTQCNAFLILANKIRKTRLHYTIKLNKRPTPTELKVPHHFTLFSLFYVKVLQVP